MSEHPVAPKCITPEMNTFAALSGEVSYLFAHCKTREQLYTYFIRYADQVDQVIKTVYDFRMGDNSKIAISGFMLVTTDLLPGLTLTGPGDDAGYNEEKFWRRVTPLFTEGRSSLSGADIKQALTTV